MIFNVLLVCGMVAGLIGGWKFAQIKNALPQRLHWTFDLASILMLMQDVFIAFFYLRGVEVVVFLLIIVVCPAAGFIALDRFGLFAQSI